MNNYTTYNRATQLRKFYKNLMWFGIITVIILGNDWLKDELQDKMFGGHLILAIWTVYLGIKAISLFTFNEECEHKMIEKKANKN